MKLFKEYFNHEPTPTNTNEKKDFEVKVRVVRGRDSFFMDNFIQRRNNG